MFAGPVVLGLLLLIPLRASAETPAAEARALIARYHEDLAVIDRARDLLEAALTRESQVDTMIMLSYVSFLWGDVRATTTEEKLAAYARGREVGERAVELAPRNHDAHLWYAINTGRWGQEKGVLRSLFLLPTLREEIEILLALDPKFTVLRIDLARLYITTDRYAEARRELQRVIDETAPTFVADWTVKDRPRARQLLESIRAK